MRDGSTKIIERTERRLGKGGQGSVYYAIDGAGKQYAVKVFNQSHDYKRELELLKKADSRYVVKFYGHASEPDKGLCYLLLEFCNSDLEKLIGIRKIIPESQAEKIINYVFRAQHDLSLQGVIHRDLKPSNIGLHFETMSSELLFDEAATAKFFKDFDFNENNGTYRIKFFDLGLSETLDENEFGSSSKSGTPVYSSPEQLRGGFQTPNSDMWSIGVIYYRILTGRLPFMG